MILDNIVASYDSLHNKLEPYMFLVLNLAYIGY